MENAPINTEMSGQTIGDYRLLRRLGSGGMAEVYLAVQESLRRNVAVKILKRHLSDNEDYVDRFKRKSVRRMGTTSLPKNTFAAET